MWEHETSSGIRGYDGGVMSTAGNLVFQGRGSGELWVYAADTGKVLKVIKTGSHIMAAPMTYAVNGEQYVAVQVGYGGSADHGGAHSAEQRRAQIPEYQPHHRLQAGRRRRADAAAARVNRRSPSRPSKPRRKAQIDAGEIKFIEQCTRCHQLGPSTTPDLAHAQ